MDIDAVSDFRASPLLFIVAPLAIAALGVLAAEPAGGDRIRSSLSTLSAVTNSDAALETLSVAGATLEPAFAPSRNAYRLRVPGDTASVAITPRLSDPAAYLSVDAVAAADGATTALPVAAGLHRVKLLVTAADHTTTRTIVLSVTRPDQALAR